MDSSVHYDIKNDIKKVSSKLLLAESIAKEKRKSVRGEFVLNFLLIDMEYILYFFGFLYLYQWRVMPEIELSMSLSHYLFNISDDYVFLLLMIFLVYSTILVQRGLFNFYCSTSYVDELFTVIRAAFISFMIAIGILFVLKTSIIYSRIVIVSYFFVIVAIAAFFRALKKVIITYLNKNNILTKNVLIIGAGKIGLELGDFIKSNKFSGFQLVGYLDDYKTGKQILGTIEQLELTIKNHKINEMYITIPSEKQIIYKLISKIRKYDVNIKIIPELFNFVSSTIDLQSSSAFPYIEVVKTPLRGLNLIFKRLVDMILSVIGIVALTPVFLLTSLMIKIESQGPVFFKQKRIGKNGAPFFMYKFRSMVVNAEELKKTLAQQNQADGPVFKMKNDPRITNIGRFIRKYSIDELPQLFNVLKGDMSLIGPRPPLPDEVEKYNDYQWRRLDIRPGITGLWQVSGRSELSFNEWVSLDVYYIENWTVALDVKILLRTIPAVLRGSGAY